MAAYTVKGHESRYVGSGAPKTKSAGKYKEAPEEGRVVPNHNNPNWHIVRQKGFMDKDFSSADKAHAHLELRKKHGWKDWKEESQGMQNLKESFSEFCKNKK